MNCNIKEECGTFREFFPDPEQRTQVHLAFTRGFLPQYVAQNPYAFFSYLYRQDLPGGATEPTRFIQSRWTLFEEKAGLAPSSLEAVKTGVLRSRRVSDLSMSLHEVEGNAAAVIQMPASESEGLAYLIAVVLLAPAARPEEWPRDVRARVFTLERTFGSATEDGTIGAVCELVGSGPNQGHVSHGFGIPIERDAFLKAIAKRLHEAGAKPGEQQPQSPENSPTPCNEDDGENLSVAQAQEALGRFFEGGDGLSAASAVRINMQHLTDPTARDFMGVRLEHCWIELHFPGARVLSQRLHQERSTVFDAVTVALPSGEQREVWFEISSFFSGAPSGKDAAGDGLDARTRNWTVGLLVVLAIGAVLAWSSRATSAEAVFTVFGILGIGGGLAIWARSPESVKESKLFGGRLSLVLGLAWFCLMSEFALIWHFFPGATIHVDNFSGKNVEIWLNGHRWVSADTGTTQVKTLTQGTYAFEVRSKEAGAILDGFTNSATSKGPYIFNTLGAQTYYEGRVDYAAPAPFSRPQPKTVENEIRARWQEVRVRYLFRRPPDSIRVDSTYRSDYQTESRSYLLRESLLGAWEKQAGQAKALLDAMDGQGRFRDQGRTVSPASAPPAGLGEPVSVRQTKVTVTPADPTVRLENGLGHHLRADSERAVAVLKTGNITGAELLADQVIRNFEVLMTQPTTNYRCFRNAAEQRRFADTNAGMGQVVWIDWRYCEILQFRAFIHAQMKQFEKALQVLDKAIQVGPHNAVAHNERGYILVQISRFREALKAYESAQEASKRTGGSRIEEAAALRGMGATWVDLGDLDKAEKALKESLLLEHGNAVARKELEYIRQLRSKNNN